MQTGAVIAADRKLWSITALAASAASLVWLILGLVLERNLSEFYCARAMSCYIGTLLTCAVSLAICAYIKKNSGDSVRVPSVVRAAYLINGVVVSLSLWAILNSAFKGLASQ